MELVSSTCIISQITKLSLNGGADVGLVLGASVGTRNDTRGPFVVDVPFVYSSSLRVSGSVHTHAI